MITKSGLIMIIGDDIFTLWSHFHQHLNSMIVSEESGDGIVRRVGSSPRASACGRPVMAT